MRTCPARRRASQFFTILLITFGLVQSVLAQQAGMPSHYSEKGTTLRDSIGLLSIDIGSELLYHVTNGILQQPGGVGRQFYFGTYNVITDEPMVHGAGYLDLRVATRPISALTLRTEIIAEQRGMSYGVYDTKSVSLLPRFRFDLDTAVRLWDERFGFSISTGHFINVRHSEGLFFFNSDAQGTMYDLSWRRLHYIYTRYGDYVGAIGLNIDDVDARQLVLKDVPVSSRLIGSFALGYLKLGQVYSSLPYRVSTQDKALRDIVSTASISFSLDSSVTAYSEAGIRNMPRRDTRVIPNSGLLAGIIGSGKPWSDLAISANYEYRFYGRLLNRDYITRGVYFRDTLGGQYDNTIGPSLYPLKNFHRPFMQWAVLTEYQGRDVAAHSLVIDARYDLGHSFFLDASLDYNRIVASYQSHWVSVLYDLGVEWQPLDRIKMTIGTSNRAMNLDKWYPTLYQLKYPDIQYTVSWNVGDGL